MLQRLKSKHNTTWRGNCAEAGDVHEQKWDWVIKQSLDGGYKPKGIVHSDKTVNFMLW